MLSRRTMLVAATALVAARGARAAESGVSAERVLFGQAAALEGPAAQLGIGMRDGIQAAFAEANRAGGVRGRRLELVSRDDGYEPTRCIETTRQLIEADGVFALIGPVGTPTSQAAQPVAQQAGVPFIGPFTGAEFLRDPALANVVNLRAPYFQETETMVERLTADLSASRIAILYQDDAFGRAGLAGVQRALAKRNMQLVAEGTYERNTTAVRGAVLAIQRGRPDAVIMIGAYRPCAEFIKVARQVRMAATFVNISFVGSDALARELGPAGAGVVVTQVVPFPRDPAVPAVARYQAALQAQDPNAEPGFVSLEGYLTGRLAIAALERIEGEPSRAAFLRAILAGNFDLDGFRLAFGPQDNQGSDTVFLTVIQPDGSFRAVSRLGAAAG
ncbi:ABC transporter substrate-binding protein [Plastoroseomonas hellenica]|uniref:ABC transporter substrate-binding protein n=1 Tax=Plastoroseomonas hellenica TaxID=2687306 RepID=UPI001BADF4C2|nr:ABC transporter substrate-binding protein [Plastoroseomonas hellenica]MBR0647609.1 ABC transporter substrate-binding protein [Plastoroseomonas hellenica]